MSKGKLIRDAVHGDIEMSSLEVELMDTPEFQRLRGIKQLGTAYLVYPSAVHTRFEHSLGTSWMAYRILQAVRRTEAISQDEERLIRVSALLHDVTHIPFGHTLEDERRVLPRHDKDEERVDYFFRMSAVARILKREGLQEPVIGILKGDETYRSDIVGGAISADLLDYLRRDTYFCGLSQYYDARISESFIIEDGKLVMNLEKQGRLRQDALSELVNLLRIRYTLSERVYYHHTKVSSGIQPHEIVIYCPSFGMSLSEAEVPVRLDRGEIRPLSGANNEEIRILKEKHKELWKFYVLIDRDVWDCRDRVKNAAAAYIG